jgi:hypothetical protein
MSVGYLVAGCLILLFSRDRTRIAAASFGLVVVLGSVNAVLSRNFVAMPLILWLCDRVHGPCMVEEFQDG